ncbi:Uncharacterised protein [Starkeya nomas]|uniref:Uncharacterized protein n=2 Tax=Xanthobacteraceae TaxID=335928 RepID=A0A5S9NY97_9HYPH|nr:MULTISPECIES: DUF6111 family protein [Xanthobacteraceae]TSJ62754.1 hypothetical protein FO470_07045 [Ancylobacter moscoviensis]CAA0095726.1 Uncharacterised protein [Starkeya nomas]
MARILAEIALFLLPFAAFALYLRYGRKVDSFLAGWSLRALIGCAVVAVLLVAASLYFIEATGRGPTTGRYVPPSWQDGVLVPGHIE